MILLKDGLNIALGATPGKNDRTILQICNWLNRESIERMKLTKQRIEMAMFNVSAGEARLIPILKSNFR